MNNCAHGFTPWGTYLAAEENWHAYFKKDDETANFSTRENTLNSRYAIGAAWAYREWDTANSADVYARFDATAGTGDRFSDYRNEPNLHGFVTEIDPFRPTQKPRVRTTFGRFSHEGAWPGLLLDWRPIMLAPRRWIARSGRPFIH